MSHPTDPLGYSDEYYLAMAALDCYLNDGGPFKSTSVIYRIHLLGQELMAARLRAASPAGAPEDETRAELLERVRKAYDAER